MHGRRKVWQRRQAGRETERRHPRVRIRIVGVSTKSSTWAFALGNLQFRLESNARPAGGGTWLTRARLLTISPPSVFISNASAHTTRSHVRSHLISASSSDVVNVSAPPIRLHTDTSRHPFHLRCRAAAATRRPTHLIPSPAQLAGSLVRPLLPQDGFLPQAFQRRHPLVCRISRLVCTAPIRADRAAPSAHSLPDIRLFLTPTSHNPKSPASHQALVLLQKASRFDKLANPRPAIFELEVIEPPLGMTGTQRATILRALMRKEDAERESRRLVQEKERAKAESAGGEEGAEGALAQAEPSRVLNEVAKEDVDWTLVSSHRVLDRLFVRADHLIFLAHCLFPSHIGPARPLSSATHPCLNLPRRLRCGGNRTRSSAAR